jgi:UDP-N-acetyl-D-mannosaminuronate dehydrogenase
MQFYDGSQISSLSSSSSELESQQGTAARVAAIISTARTTTAAEESIGDLTSRKITTNVDADILNNHAICNSVNKNNNKDSNNNISHGNNTKITSLGIPMHPVPEIEIAELTKIIENAHRYLQIAFAEDLYLYCQANNINFAELRDSLNTKWNVNILEPREGIGGHCLPKDTKMFLNSSKSIKSKILEAATEVDNDYRRFRGDDRGRSISNWVLTQPRTASYIDK